MCWADGRQVKEDGGRAVEQVEGGQHGGVTIDMCDGKIIK
jgi:hypothetical protein